MIIKTPDGWKPWPCREAIPAPNVTPLKYPFRCWQTAGARSLKEWLRK